MWHKELVDVHVTPNPQPQEPGEPVYLLAFQTDAPDWHVASRLQKALQIFSASYCLWRFWDAWGCWFLLQVTEGRSASPPTTIRSASEPMSLIETNLRRQLRPYAFWPMGVAKADTLPLVD